MGIRASKPLFCYSKLFCISVIYLFTTLFLVLYTYLISPTNCLFRYSPNDPIQTPLFLYNSSYGEHKHALPTFRSSCNSPVYFSDRIAMENCKGVVVISAIFNDHDKIRQPKGLGKETPYSVCFYMFVDDVTLKGLQYHNLISTTSLEENSVGVWRIVMVEKENLYENSAMNGVIPKYLVHRLFPNSKYSIWIDAKMQLVVDPFLLIHSLVVMEDVDMAISRHPFYVHTMEEAMATARWKKWWDVDGLKKQMETYCDNGLQPWTPEKPYPSDVPDSAIILRKHSVATNLFSCLLFNELEGFNPRDQLPFAYVRDLMDPKLKLNMFDVEVFEQVAVEYRHSLKNDGVTNPKVIPKKTKRASSKFLVNGTSSKCDSYLLKMWGESQD
ncbi:alkaline ceramidase TOD1 isoform X1 [Solanum dulcamara]|uniref:alkaline ceramidase TOD1 isoform X1 n=1 Tax=Solanum dulcamara TaxID=45834 RepID=UPI002485548D|nr:alkaline ceramidase TOD1 isoform X1 [Solanum dulcamara]